jgi:hypothetical protein
MSHHGDIGFQSITCLSLYMRVCFLSKRGKPRASASNDACDLLLTYYYLFNGLHLMGYRGYMNQPLKKKSLAWTFPNRRSSGWRNDYIWIQCVARRINSIKERLFVLLKIKSLCVFHIVQSKSQTLTRVWTLPFFTNTMQPITEHIRYISGGEKYWNSYEQYSK